MRSICFAVLLAFTFTGFSDVARSRTFLDIFPAYPIKEIGEPIPAETINGWIAISTFCRSVAGRFKDFPAKADFKPRTVADAENPADDPIESVQDARYYCDDGDQTTYNGMLCAAGVEIGCSAVADARDDSGRWFRSPHRRWMWSARCSAMKERQSLDYGHRCANGFSPDMNLGVLLYTLHTKNLTHYNKWLDWLDDNAAKTVLCKVEGDEKTGFKVSDCTPQEWPRVCTDDLGYTKGSFAVFGKYGGNCALRPWDALDFAAVNQALGIAPRSRLSNWEATSRVMIRVGKEFAGAVVPVTRLLEAPPLVLMSLVDTEKKYPLHLDAVRVLIRMMILNPSLKTDNLPAIPTPENLPGALGVLASDTTDPISVSIAAKTLERRNPSNPFFSLLANGPTPKVREDILKKCPSAADPKEGKGIDRHHWLWEKGPQENIYNKDNSMGWDCVFVGSLYNKMRVKKDLTKELLDKLLALADPVAAGLNQATQALQLLEADQALKQKALDQARRDFKNATDFRDTEHAKLKAAAEQALKEALAKLTALQKEVQDLEKSIPELTNKVAAVVIPNPPPCPPDPTGLCNKARNEVIKKAQDGRDALNHQLTDAQSRLTSIRSALLAEAQKAVNDRTKDLANLDDKLKSVLKKIEAGSFAVAISAANEALKLSQAALAKGRERLAEWKRVDTRVKGTLAVWQNDDKAEKALEQPAEVAVLPPSGSRKSR